MSGDLNSLHQTAVEQLNHAKEGLAYYSKLVQTLEATVKSLSEFGITTPAKESNPAPRGRKTTYSPRKAKSAKVSVLRKAQASDKVKGQGAKEAGSDTLPPTGTEFWLAHLPQKDQAISRKDYIAACAKALGDNLSETQKKKLLDRVGFAIADLSRKKLIGKTDDRRLYKA